ncbi:hypothetical protein GF366_02910 [Candidatus Peregrinibacteria bacterium]|nr:hypothetical protein [Candidatus Peregrinibacteria bacterium]
MKRIALLSAIVICVPMFLAGCDNDEYVRDEAETMSMTGILTEQKSGDDFSGTHLLTDENDVATPLRSLSINLSNSQYLNNKVKVMGFKNPDDQVFEVTGISVTEVLEDEDEEADFIGYKNTDFGIQLKYYDDWEIEERPDKISFHAPSEDGEGDSIEISQFIYAYEPVIPEEEGQISALTSFMDERHPEIDEYEFKVIGVDNLDAVKVLKSGEMVDYYIYRSGLVYRISFIENENFNEENKKIFNEMISEFRFTGFTVEEDEIIDSGFEEETTTEETSAEETGVEEISEVPEIDMELTSFESLPYHFSAKYPSNWYYAGSRGTEEGVRHHYGFSDESVTDENEIISLDVISDDLPPGTNINFPNGNGVKVIENGKINIYASIDNQNYRVSGPVEYESLMIVMADSITPIEIEDE